MAKGWDAAQKTAKQILGPNAKIPDMLPSVSKAAEKSRTSWTNFKTAGKALKDALDDYKEQAANFFGAWDAQEDEIKKEDFGLDPKKNKDDAKKIAAARKEFIQVVEDVLKMNKSDIDDVKKFEAAVKVIMDAK